jgi:hypothetical protein
MLKATWFAPLNFGYSVVGRAISLLQHMPTYNEIFEIMNSINLNVVMCFLIIKLEHVIYTTAWLTTGMTTTV